ncbi:MAG: archease [Candidatus Nezhaarchaeota archaeon]|nr:archease [Candidatus Nezhaarchaeota archaeon]
MPNYELFETTADVGVRGYGSTLEEAFENAAKAMFSVMTDISLVRPSSEDVIEIEAEEEEALLVDWLNELLARSSIKRMLFSEFRVSVERLHGSIRLRALAYGEPIDPARHELRTEVKAATYALIKVGRVNDKYVAQLLLDI